MDGHTVHDRKFNYYVLFDQLEWQGTGSGGAKLENTSWFGGDVNRAWIRFDTESGAYWTLANAVPGQFRSSGGKPASIRNTLALLKSVDLRNWEYRATLLRHPDSKAHAFQYPDWQFDEGDIIAAVRTAFDDEYGGAHNAHDANYLTFHRFRDFRRLVEPAAAD